MNPSTNPRLHELTFAGAHKRWGDNLPPETISRLELELKVMEFQHCDDYILSLANYIQKIRDEGIMISPGFGAAPSSAVLYALGVTSVDPIKHGLLFERFMSAHECNFPRIELSFSGDLPKVDLSSITYDDPKILDAFNSDKYFGHTYPPASRSFQKWFKRVHVDSFDDLVALAAMYTPNLYGKLEEYAAAKHSGDDGTSSLLIYQEQLMQIAQTAAGFTPDLSELLRKTMRRPPSVMLDELKKEFLQGCEERQHPNPEELWNRLLSAAPDLALKAHCCCAATLGYWQMFSLMRQPRQV